MADLRGDAPHVPSYSPKFSQFHAVFLKLGKIVDVNDPLDPPLGSTSSNYTDFGFCEFSDIRLRKPLS